MASRQDGTLYTGVTSDLVTRVARHKKGEFRGFTDRYQIKNLVWFEQHGTMEGAILREKEIKKWRREWKIELIEAHNPVWRDLYETIL